MFDESDKSHTSIYLVKAEMGGLVRADFEVPYYDLTSTCFEGEMERNPKAKRGYSRDDNPGYLPRLPEGGGRDLRGCSSSVGDGPPQSQ